MTEHGSEGDPEVGSVADEAAKLVQALSDWAREHGEGAGAGIGGTFAGLAEMARDVDAHVAGENCTYCPLCRLIGVVRATSPEVRAHLTSAASSLLQAAAGALATPVPREGGRGAEPVHKIDLDGAWPDDDPEPPDGPPD